MAKTLSIKPDVPQYPNVYRAFKNAPVFNEVRNGAQLGQYQKDLPQQKVEAVSVPVFYEVRNRALLSQYQNDLPQQKVGAVSEWDYKKNEAHGRFAEFEADGDGFVQQEKGKFHLSKWKIYKEF
ncbi:hypothetical protein NL676_003315 [Syzygium grande]|nr:hypothetical protein NL676_003315 [Syzygium grande]